MSGGESAAARGDGLAPVIPLFEGGRRTITDRAEIRRSEREPREPEASALGHSGWIDDDGYGDLYAEDGADSCAAIEREIAEKNLLKRLRARSLSVREARAVVAARDLDEDAIAGVLATFEQLGYLDDTRLAEQVVHAGVDRKGQGRPMIAQALAKRGISRDIAEAALAELPDDDAERALEFARSKARSMRSLDRETAVRRLSGQLARRGYGGATAMNAARTALDELERPARGVRFV